MALIFALGILDVVTGTELGLFVFYFAPVMIAGWWLGLPSSIVTAILAALAWFAADALAGNVYSHLALGVWNTGVRLVSFLIIGFFTARFAALLATERRTSADLAKALAEVDVLRGLLPICAWCKQIRDENGAWQQVETYIARHSDVEFTHGMCDDCAARVLREAEAS
ncbi:MAG: hypothetical protein ABJF88_04020 [Rhodothermales bacterium]